MYPSSRPAYLNKVSFFIYYRIKQLDPEKGIAVGYSTLRGNAMQQFLRKYKLLV